MQNDVYKSRWGISQSSIKDFRFKSPKVWKGIWMDKEQDPDRDKDSFTFGSLTDTLAFTPNEMEERFFIVEDSVIPSKAIEVITKLVYNDMIIYNTRLEEINKDLPEEEAPLDNWTDEIILNNLNNYREKKESTSGWYSNWKEETRINKFKEQAAPLFNILKSAHGRKIISSSLNMQAVELVNILRKDEFVKAFFIQEEGETLLFQTEIFTSYELDDGYHLPIKGAIDIIRIRHTDKTVQVVDFKTTLSAFDFIKSIKQYGYCEQLSFYNYLVKKWLKEYEDGKYKDYTILEPANIAIDTKDKIPYFYEYSWIDINLAAGGNKNYLFHLFQTNDHIGKIKPGWEETLKEIGWHYTSNLWDKPRELYETNRIKVNLLN